MLTRSRFSAIRIALSILSLGFGLWVARPLLAQKPAQTPGEFYLSYVAAAEKMKSLKDITPFMPADQAAMMSKLAKEPDQKMLEEIKKELVTSVKVLKETPNKDGVLLTMEGMRKAAPSKKLTGWAQIVKEGGQWKLERDDWSGTSAGLAGKSAP
jgi:hypothetical protein